MRKIYLLLICMVSIITFTSCDKSNQVTEEEWNAAISDISNVTVDYTHVKSTIRNELKGYYENNVEVDGLTRDQLEALVKDDDLKSKEIFKYSYNEDYYYSKEFKMELINTDLDVNIGSENFDIEFYRIHDEDSSENSGNFGPEVLGYSNYYYEYNQETNKIELVNEWAEAHILMMEIDMFFNNLVEYSEYQYNSEKDCYETEIQYNTNDNKIYSKDYQEVYFTEGKISKIYIEQYFTESYVNGMDIILDDDFILMSEITIEFTNYDNTVITLPKEIEDLRK